MHQMKQLRAAAVAVVPALIGIAFTGLTGCHAPGQPSANRAAGSRDARTLRIGYQKGATLNVLRLRGDLERRLAPLNIKVVWLDFPAGPQMLEALGVDSIDLASTGDAPAIFAQAAGLPIVYIANSPPALNGQDRAILVPANSPIRTVADLRGKRVAIQKGSGTHNFLIQALQKAGVDYKDITPVYLSPPDARPAFQSGSVDAWAIWEPFLSIAQQATGARTLVDGKGIVSAGGFYLSSQTFARAHADWLRIALEEIETTGRWSSEHPRAAAELLAPGVGLNVDLLEQIQKRATPPGQRYVAYRPIDARVMSDQQTVADIFYRIGLLPHRVNVGAGLLTPQEYAGLTPQRHVRREAQSFQEGSAGQ